MYPTDNIHSFRVHLLISLHYTICMVWFVSRVNCERKTSGEAIHKQVKNFPKQGKKWFLLNFSRNQSTEHLYQLANMVVYTSTTR